mmetsp:Transcript_90422/g.142826  ORF Transcript_90422/g.142826 Transcript_90422/m.142826 type:complete len:151 (-) Transcript_90422:43-495(-)
MLFNASALRKSVGTPARAPQLTRGSTTAPPATLLSAWQEASLRAAQPFSQLTSGSSTTAAPATLVAAWREASLRAAHPISQVSSPLSSALSPPATPRCPQQTMTSAQITSSVQVGSTFSSATAPPATPRATWQATATTPKPPSFLVPSSF